MDNNQRESQPDGLGKAPPTDMLPEQLRYLLDFARLAPSGHNTQPWRFRLLASHAELYADRTRCLPVVDPFDRELSISCGAAIGYFEIAARYAGLQAHVHYESKPEDPDLLACLDVTQGSPANQGDTALYNAIPGRVTDRTGFEMNPISKEVINDCRALADRFDVELSLVAAAEQRHAVAELVSMGDKMQFDNPSFRRELASWVHSYRLGSRDGMSGASFGMPDLLAPLGQLVIRTFDIGEGVAASDAEKIISATPALLVLSTPADDLAAWLDTGRALAHILLSLSANGLASSYLNQPIEVETLRPQLKNLVKVFGMPQILLRIGEAKGPPVKPTVRRSLDDLTLA